MNWALAALPVLCVTFPTDSYKLLGAHTDIITLIPKICLLKIPVKFKVMLMGFVILSALSFI